MATHIRHAVPFLSGLDVIFARRSIRAYTGDRLDKETIAALLEAAVHAPTALHFEPWAFVVVQDAEMLARISHVAKSLWTSDPAQERELRALGDRVASYFAGEMADPSFDLFYDAGTLVVICGKPMGPFVTADCWLAAGNLMLAACAMGLGSCCIGSAVGALNTPALKAELGIPAEVTAVAPIVVGVPQAGSASPGQRKSPDILSWR